MSAMTYPVHLDADLEPGLSRWLWLVKWFLAIPHYVVLVFLWIGFVAASLVAFFAILFTGRYPTSLFEYNVGVLRWSWRVSYYTYAGLGTDRYPPFTLDDVPDYPAHFDVDPPQHLSRGLVLVKWWLLAIPHYAVVGIFAGGGFWALSRTTHDGSGGPGLIGLMVFIAAVVLLFTGRYPRQIFDFVLGMNRWCLRVAAYSALMTDDYPPFRLDMGGHEPGGTTTVAAVAVAPRPAVAEPVAGEPTTPPPTAPAPFQAPPPRRGWTGFQIVSLIIGAVLGLTSLGLFAGAGVLSWATNTQRDSAGYITTHTHTLHTASYALTSDGIDLGDSTDWITAGDVLGTVRIRATASDPRTALFVGVADRASAESYLAGVRHSVVTNWPEGHTHLATVAGNAQPKAPAGADIWAAQTTGTGTQTLTWKPNGGEWVVVVMNSDGHPGVAVDADVGARVPDLGWIAGGLAIAGMVLLIGSALLIAIPAVRASRR
ncbi:MAG TPA: DUF4389 domain-containing protein [Mycobacteriales bacterium]|jgi:hypothetical protein|nr:DUF4389 domain-containing protein [Mycobacteriales bacterium]